MAYHIVFNRPIDLTMAITGARKGANPRHSMAMLAEELDATIHDGTGLTASVIDRMLGRLTRTRPLWWAIARQLRRETAPGDVIYCTGEDVGVPVAVLCGRGRHVAIMTHYVARGKGKLALAPFRFGQRVALFFAVARPQADFLQRYLNLPAEQVRFLWDQTDTDFFSPGPASPGKTRPLVMSVGLEQRDYTTLAMAIADLDIDVRISGFSQDTKVLARAFPEKPPANMSRRFYAWPELQQLYRDADIVIVSLFPNSHAAGVQALMEGLACGKPVVVTTTTGLQGYLDRADAMRTVPAGDAAAMRWAITSLLDQPQERAAIGAAAAALARDRHQLEDYVATIVAALRNFPGFGESVADQGIMGD